MRVTRSFRSLVALGAAELLALGGLSTAEAATATASPAPASTHRHLVESPAEAALVGAVAPSECEGTLLDTYIDLLFADMTDEQFAFLVAHQDTLFNVPTYALLSFYTVGDCQFGNPGHHGTPLQRERAADWGADLAAAARPRSYILPPATFVELFDAALPQIISGS